MCFPLPTCNWFTALQCRAFNEVAAEVEKLEGGKVDGKACGLRCVCAAECVRHKAEEKPKIEKIEQCRENDQQIVRVAANG